ncbi:TetR/AcrR family transcriptional regulator [Pedococcus sp. NPDC057267]|uniref:TetR/AcrR family transcriptional regulator n=1 Tax=Pedococcus sp. NPDC057267 TaxID=3346077 RepID=UPI00363E0219
MGRWEPGARARLRDAALDLFSEHGYEQTTVAQIAARAELTERTFYRHFADKREVLFDGQEQFVARFVDPMATSPTKDVPGSAGALDLVAAALRGAGSWFTPAMKEFATRRQAVIEAEPSLRERELLKLGSLADALADALVARGVPTDRAALAAQAGVSVFRVAFARWIASGDDRSLQDHLDRALDELRSLTAQP